VAKRVEHFSLSEKEVQAEINRILHSRSICPVGVTMAGPTKSRVFVSKMGRIYAYLEEWFTDEEYLLDIVIGNWKEPQRPFSTT